jgi:oligopeptide transport system permease protein
MTRFVLGRLLWLAPTLLAIFTISFFLLRAAPGSPFVSERAMSEEVRQQREHAYYLDQPWYVQYGYTLRDLATLRGQLSMKYENRNVIWDVLAPAFPISVSLGLLALTISFLVGVAAGVYSAVRRYRAGEQLVTGLALLGISLPSFVIASLLMMIFAFWLQIFPAGGWGDWRQLVLPAVTLAAFPAAYIARLTRNSMLDTLPSDYIRVAYCKGLPASQVIFLHGLKNAFLPVLSYLGPAAAAVFTGSFVVERIFAIPGVGHHFVQSALNRDHPLILASVMLYSTLLIVMNLLVDIGYAWLDPRIRYD